jgi:ribonuclease Z
MSLRILFLGTAASVPTPTRSLPAILIQRKDEYLLFDAGESVQRQMIKAKTGFHKKMKVFISHMHGDHVLGLPGLLQTMALNNRQKAVEVYGPVGIKRFLECIQETVQFVLTFPLRVHELEGNRVVCEETDYTVETACSNHVIPSQAYALTEKPRPGKFHPEKARELHVPEGKLWSELQHGRKVTLPNGRTVVPAAVLGPQRRGRKITYSGDTRTCEAVIQLARESDVLIHEATLDDSLAEKAVEDGHSTPTHAAETAKKANVRLLVLTHISARYTDATLFLLQAQKTFSNTLIAEDFTELALPLSEG